MTEPAFFVDGHMESRIIKKIGCNYPVRRIDTNGRDVSVEAIAKKIELLYRTLNNKNYPIIIIVDRECREINCKVFRENIEKSMEDRGLDLTQFKICVCDRMIENWILADPEMLANKYERFKRKNYEGELGKAVIKKLFRPENPYNESTDGVNMFVEARASEMRKNSASFSVLYQYLDDECWWKKR